MNYVIVAHYDEFGRISSDLSDFINFLQGSNFQIILVSTCLNEAEFKKISQNIKIIVRDNYGYDFYSYRVGIDFIKNSWDYIDNIILMNSSFKIFNDHKLYNFFAKVIAKENQKYDVLSLTTSMEIRYHCQSFLLRFNRKVLNSLSFQNWWSSMQPISDRQQVIYQYELGLTDFLLQQNFTSSSLFHIGLLRKVKSMLRYFRLTKTWSSWSGINPCHFLWDELYHDYGIVKYELINKNPHNININKIL